MRKVDMEKLIKKLERKLRKTEKLLAAERVRSLEWYQVAMEADAADILAHWPSDARIRKDLDG